MTINELIAEKNILEKNLTALVKKFEQNTGVIVSDLFVNREFESSEELLDDKMNYLRVEVKLYI